MWDGHLFLVADDPAPLPPAAFGTADYWRWTSARRLTEGAMDSERFRVELDTKGFRSQLSEVGARELVRRLAFEGAHVTSIVWVRSEGTPADRDADATVSQATANAAMERSAA